jgi:hypothetical protein
VPHEHRDPVRVSCCRFNNVRECFEKSHSYPASRYHVFSDERRRQQQGTKTSSTSIRLPPTRVGSTQTVDHNLAACRAWARAGSPRYACLSMVLSPKSFRRQRKKRGWRGFRSQVSGPGPAAPKPCPARLLRVAAHEGSPPRAANSNGRVRSNVRRFSTAAAASWSASEEPKQPNQD